MPFCYFGWWLYFPLEKQMAPTKIELAELPSKGTIAVHIHLLAATLETLVKELSWFILTDRALAIFTGCAIISGSWPRDLPVRVTAKERFQVPSQSSWRMEEEEEMVGDGCCLFWLWGETSASFCSHWQFQQLVFHTVRKCSVNNNTPCSTFTCTPFLSAAVSERKTKWIRIWEYHLPTCPEDLTPEGF